MELNIDTSELQFFLRAVAINIKKLIEKCIDTYNSFFQLSPENAVEIHQELGDNLEKKGNHDGAIKAYQKILLTEPVNVSVLFKLGKIYTLSLIHI